MPAVILDLSDNGIPVKLTADLPVGSFNLLLRDPK